MRPIRATQQTLVFLLFLVMFAGFGLFLPGFIQFDNLLTLLQNVAILGILGLGMALVVIGRGIDISMIAAMAVPSGFLLQMVQSGQPLASACLIALLLSLAFGLVNGWLIALCRGAFFVHHLGLGLVPCGIGTSLHLPT